MYAPYSLLAEQVLSDAIGDRDIPINWQAFELRSAPVLTLKPEDPVPPGHLAQVHISSCRTAGRADPVERPSITACLSALYFPI